MQAIELNIKIDSEISKVKTDIKVCEVSINDYLNKIERVNNDIEVNKLAIIDKDNLIIRINKEDEIDKIYKIYIDLVGKKGISKLVIHLRIEFGRVR